MQQYDIYVQGRYYRTVESNNSMDIVWNVTNELPMVVQNGAIPWYNKTKPADITVKPAGS